MIWLLLPIFDWSIVMIVPSGLLLVVPTYLWSLFQSYGRGCKKVYRVERLVSRHLVAFKPLLFYWMIGWQCFWKTKCKLAIGTPMTLWITLNGEQTCKVWPLKVKGVKIFIKIGYVHLFLVVLITSLLWAYPYFCIIVCYLPPSLG